MKRLLNLVFVLSVLGTVYGAIDSPYKNYPLNLKGEMHTHSTESDGKVSPIEVMKYWLARGYNFSVITDHNTLTIPPNVPGIVHIKAAEMSGGSGQHMNNFGLTSIPSAGNAQKILDSATRQGAIVQLNHAHRDNAWDTPKINALRGLWGIEILNLGNEIDSTDLWDDQISQGKKIWATVGDDMHTYSKSDTTFSWVMVNANSATPDDILANLKTGNFYCSEGPNMKVGVSGNTISVTTDKASTIKFIHQGRAVVSTVPSTTTASYQPTASDKHIRVEVVNSSGKRAWSQPMFVSGGPIPDPPGSTGGPIPDPPGSTGGGGNTDNCMCKIISS